jgi:hypothetical protein
MAFRWKAAFIGGLFAVSTALAAGGQTKQQERSQSTWEQEQEQGIGGAGQYGQQQAGQQASFEGQVVETKGQQLFLKLENGAILPFVVNAQTFLENPEQLQQLRGTGGAGEQEGKQSEEEAGQGGAGQQGQQAQKQIKGKQLLQHLQPGYGLKVNGMQEGNQNIAQSISLSGKAGEEIKGKVVSAQGNRLHLEYQGALLPLQVNQQTKYEGMAQNKKISGLTDVKPGDEVRASFVVKDGTSNLAKSIVLEKQGEQSKQQQQRGGQQQ